MANRLIIFANFIAFAEDQGYRVNNCTFHSYAHLFETTRRDIYCRYPLPKRRSCFDLVPGAAKLIRFTRVFYRAVWTASRTNERAQIFGRSTITLREIKGQPITSLEG